MSSQNRISHTITFTAISIIGAICDIVSKYWVFGAIAGEPGKTNIVIPVIPKILQFGKVINPGIVWGLFPHNGKLFLVVSFLAIPIIIAIFVLIKNPTWYSTVSFGLILAGTIGNFYDRVYFHGVRDFIHFYCINFPLFNLADSYITVGVVVMSFYLLFIDGRQNPAPTSAPNS